MDERRIGGGVGIVVVGVVGAMRWRVVIDGRYMVDRWSIDGRW
jgi:hypothetical protein